MTEQSEQTDVRHTAGEWSIHCASQPDIRRVSSEDGSWEYRDIVIGSGEKTVATVHLCRAPSPGYPKVIDEAELEANADIIIRAVNSHNQLAAALLAVVDATRDYLPPDGISEQECISRILEATDNPLINPVISEIENGRS